MSRTVLAAAFALALVVAGCSRGSSSNESTQPPKPSVSIASAQRGSGGSASTSAVVGAVPRTKHIVVVVMENHSYDDVIGNRAAPFINSLAESGALFTQSFAVTHPSEPNYLALFSGSTQGLTDDSCPHTYSGPNLASELVQAGKSFVGYSEGLPRAGSTVCTHGVYARKHVPWVNFARLPADTDQPFSAFPRSYSKLPLLAFVIPDLTHDMHNGTIAQGDLWLRQNLSAYAGWARTHGSLLVVTWDEDDRSQANQIPTIFVGAQVRPGRYSEHLTHYRLLRTLVACLGIPALGASKDVGPVTDIWRR